jgi:hypothetical protein
MGNIEKNEGGNFGEIKSIYLVASENVQNVTPPDNEHAAEITLNSGISWDEIYFTPQTDVFKCGYKERNSIGYYDFKLSFSVPKIRSDILVAAKSYLGKKLLVKFTDKNNTSYLAGDNIQFVLMEASPVIKSKNNAIEFTLHSKLSDFPYFLSE